MMGTEQIFELGRRAIWDQDVNALPAWKARGLQVARVIYKISADLIDGDLPLRAMSLVYTTLLSLVPLLAVSFSVLKGFGVHNQIEPILLQFLAPLGEKGAEVSAGIIGFVENMKVGVLGSVGLAFLLYTVISLLQKIEAAFNFTWHTTTTRSFGQRFSDYLSVIMIGPVLMFTAIGMSGAIRSTSMVEAIVAIEPFGTLLEMFTKLLPYLLVIAAFTFVYTFVPNTKVRLRSAFLGALVGGVLWQTVAVLFASFVASSARYTAIYSGFAIIIFLMMWMYVSWLILLIGACIAFYHQHPEYLVTLHDDASLSGRVKEKAALLIAFLVGQGHFQGRKPWTLDDLSQRLSLPMDALAGVVGGLTRAGLLTLTASDPPGYLPGRAIESIRMIEVLDAVRNAEEHHAHELGRVRSEAPVEELLDGVDRAVRESMRDRTLAELVHDSAPATPGPRRPTPDVD